MIYIPISVLGIFSVVLLAIGHPSLSLLAITSSCAAFFFVQHSKRKVADDKIMSRIDFLQAVVNQSTQAFVATQERAKRAQDKADFVSKKLSQASSQRSDFTPFGG